MSGLRFKFSRTVSLAASTTLTLGQILAATNTRCAIERLTISVMGAAIADKAIRFELLRQTGGTASSATLTKIDSDAAETLQTTAKETFTVEPTAGSILWSEQVGAWGGKAIYIPTVQDGLLINGGDIVGLRGISPALSAAAAVTFDFDLRE